MDEPRYNCDEFVFQYRQASHFKTKNLNDKHIHLCTYPSLPL